MIVIETVGYSPSALPVVRALAADLEGEPLVGEIPLLQGIVTQTILSVVLLDEVVNNSPRLPERQVGVRILNSLLASQLSVLGHEVVHLEFLAAERMGKSTGNAAIGIDICEWLLLDIFEPDGLDLVGHA
jgi:hypothetical protein